VGRLRRRRCEVGHIMIDLTDCYTVGEQWNGRS
jgi:hypothetical protein